MFSSPTAGCILHGISHLNTKEPAPVVRFYHVIWSFCDIHDKNKPSRKHSSNLQTSTKFPWCTTRIISGCLSTWCSWLWCSTSRGSPGWWWRAASWSSLEKEQHRDMSRIRTKNEIFSWNFSTLIFKTSKCFVFKYLTWTANQIILGLMCISTGLLCVRFST